tara:strand:- start:28 stop:213 length:186 start_codon:yes stop_codon:yes gene_type:complete
MQFIKKTSSSRPNSIFKLGLKVSLGLGAIIIIIVLLNQIDFPAPNKEIEKIVPNEKLKVVK